MACRAARSRRGPIPPGSSRNQLTFARLFDISTYVELSKALPALAALAQETRLGVYRLLVEHAPEGLPAGQIAERLEVPALWRLRCRRPSAARLPDLRCPFAD